MTPAVGDISRSLRARFLLPLLLIGAAVGLAGGWLTHSTFARRLDKEAEARSLAIVTSINAMIVATNRTGELAETEVELQRVVHDVGSLPDVTLIVVVSGATPRVIACTREEWLGRPMSDLPYERVQEDLLDAIETGVEHRHFHRDTLEYDISWPLALRAEDRSRGGRADGAIMVHLDARPVRRQLRVAAWEATGALLVSVAAVMALAWVLLQGLVLSPLGRIRAAMSRRAAGDRAAIAPEGSGDEIGDVARSLNSMLAALAESERAVLAARDQLETQVQQRTRELASANTSLQAELLERLRAECELRESHEQLRRSDRLATVGTLAAGVAHDLSNLLLSIRSRIRVLEQGNLAPESQQHLTDLRQSVRLLQHLADSLRLCAMDPEAPGREPGAGVGGTDVRAWWEQVGGLLTKTLQSRVAPRQSALTVEIPEGLPPVGVAPHRLTQAVLNLVVNAADAAREEARVHLSAEQGSEGAIRLAVTDSGQGMSADVARRAFDPFFTTRPRGSSTGLGLAIVQGVARAAGGTVEISSEPGVGTTVSMTLPVAGPGVERIDETEGRLGVATVSIADSRVAAYVTSMLSAAGFRVERVAGDAEPAGGALWVTEPTARALGPARRFLAGGGRGVIVLGESSDDWLDIGAVELDVSFDIDALRDALRAAGFAASEQRNGETEGQDSVY